MKRANYIGSLVLDAINQDSLKSSDFFGYEDVAQIVMIFWAQVFQEEFDKKLKIALSTGSKDVKFPDSWYKPATLKLEEASNGTMWATLPCYMSFNDDDYNIAIKGIRPGKDEKCNCDMSIIPYDQRGLCKFLPNSDKSSYAYILNNTIQFARWKCKDVKEIEILYIPGIDDDIDESIEAEIIPEGMIAKTMILTYNYLVTAKQQNPIVDKTNDSNPNRVIQTELSISPTPQNT